MMTLEERVSALEQIVGRSLGALAIRRGPDAVELPSESSSGATVALKPAVQALEAKLIREALSLTRGKKSGAARLLGISRPALNDKLKRAVGP